MVDSGPHQVESKGSQRQNDFLNLERRRDREGNVHTVHTGESQSQMGSHISHVKNTKDMQMEIDHLKRKLRHKRQRQTPSHSDSSSDDKDDSSYRRRSRTPPSESLSYEEEYHHERRDRNKSSRGMGNNAMSRALNQISKSPFTRRIEGGKLPRWFNSPTFTIYNGRTEPVEHVSHFNQRMAVHSRNEALICKVFLSSLGVVVMRWFDGLGASSINSFKELT